MNKYLNFFDAVYYINLDDRTDRRQLFENQIKELEIPAIRFSAITPKEGEYRFLPDDHPRRKFQIGCTLSHQAIVKEAKEKDYKNVLIFEDDCIFLEGFKEKSQLYINELKEIDWDLFYFGGDPNSSCSLISENLVKLDEISDISIDPVGGVYCTHAYAINNTFYDRILSIDANTTQSIDTLLANRISNSANVILGREILVVQSESFSDLWGVTINSKEMHINAWKKAVGNNL